MEHATTAPARKPRLKKLTKRTIMNASSNDGGDLLTEKEKEMLFQSLQDLNPND